MHKTNTDHILILGMGITGLSLLNYLSKKNKTISVYDQNKSLDKLKEITKNYEVQNLYIGDVNKLIFILGELGVKVNLKDNICKIHGVGMQGYRYKKNIVINAKNSGTLGRLISGILIDTPFPIKLIGDKSLSRRDFSRVITPLKKFGAIFKSNKNKLPISMMGNEEPNPINYLENKGFVFAH